MGAREASGVPVWAWWVVGFASILGLATAIATYIALHSLLVRHLLGHLLACRPGDAHMADMVNRSRNPE